MPRQTLKSGDSIEAEVQEEKKINTYDSEEEMLEAVQQKIDTAIEQEQEEEFEELVIPSADELKGMTKSKIKEVAESLNFEVSTTDTKDTMIESIATQTESLIESLQESDEFVSATETVKGEEDDDRRDGGYF
jgi:endonuclease IV